MPSTSFHHGVVAEINLSAIARNYRLLKARAGNADTAAAVKADGYGLGALKIVETLYQEGCRSFYVAHYKEALPLRAAFKDIHIAVLGGLPPHAEDDAAANNITPVINERHALDNMRVRAAKQGRALPVILHVDTGMNRLGFDMHDFEKLADDENALAGLDVKYVMSHLASSDEPESPQNAAQLERFKKASAFFPHIKKSFANSCGIFLGHDYHFDEVRPGRALSGMNMPASFGVKMDMAVRLMAPILQIREVAKSRSVGYNATETVKAGTRLATLAAGYADGLLRALSNTDKDKSHSFYIGNIPCPLVGRVSMDLIVVDVSNVPPPLATIGTMVDIAGPHQNIDDLAASAGTSGYEFLTLISPRVERRYIF